MPPNPVAIAEYMASLCKLLREHGVEALLTAKESTSPLRARNYLASGRSIKGDVNDRTGDLVAGRVDKGKSDLYDRMGAALVDLERSLDGVAAVFGKATHRIDPAEAKRKLRPPGSGDCGVCGRWVSGTGNDRIKSGYCPKDYEAWRTRSDKNETRSGFEHRRRQEKDDE